MGTAQQATQLIRTPCVSLGDELAKGGGNLGFLSKEF